MVASDSMTNLGVSGLSLSQVIFSFGTAPEYEPYEVVESSEFTSGRFACASAFGRRFLECGFEISGRPKNRSSSGES